MNIESTNIKVFPCAKRDDSYDRQARLNTEKNLTNIINRLTNKSSFVITPLKIESNKLKAKDGSTTIKCNMEGYYIEFTTTSGIDLGSLVTAGTAANIYFAVTIATSSNFESISGTDELNSTTSNYEYTGFTITTSPASGAKTLKIVEYDGSTFTLCDNIGFKYDDSSVYIPSDHIPVTGVVSNLTGLLPDTSSQKDMSLYDFFTNLVIDDGEL